MRWIEKAVTQSRKELKLWDVYPIEEKRKVYFEVRRYFRD